MLYNLAWHATKGQVVINLNLKKGMSDSPRYPLSITLINNMEDIIAFPA